MSEIAKHDRDHATSGDLLERALFSYGRAVHSTFSKKLSEGKARLSFRRPENREFWLAAWRYISNLGMRSTWRTAFEWAKLLLGLDPDKDSYCIRLVIDQLALRARQPKQLINIIGSDYLQDLWKMPPNLEMSVALAYYQDNRQQLARSTLRSAIQEYPWVAARLCRELEIAPIPKPIWGKEPGGDYDNLLCELYVTKAKDIWNTPEATSLLVEVASTCDWNDYEPREKVQFDELQVARHVILVETPALISLLDRRLTAQYTLTSDPLPPPDNLPSYHLNTGEPHPALLDTATVLREYANLQSFFRALVPWLFDRNNGGEAVNPDTGAPPTFEDVQRAIQESNVPNAVIVANTRRLEVLRQHLEQLHEALDVDGEHSDADGTVENDAADGQGRV